MTLSDRVLETNAAGKHCPPRGAVGF